jgi:ribulose-phosphate 3-epimerase
MIIAPTITASTSEQFLAQFANVSSFAKTIHIDITDGVFAPTSLSAPLDFHYPKSDRIDYHVMYAKPAEVVEQLIHVRPNLVIIHAEADTHHAYLAARLHRAGIKAGLAIMQHTSVESVEHLLSSFDHVLIFSGNLGHQGGSSVDFDLLKKVEQLRSYHFEGEIGWDGGVNVENIHQLKVGGIDIVNVGGYIQMASDPGANYKALHSAADRLDKISL